MAWEPNDLDLRANYDLGVEAGKALREQEIIKLLEDNLEGVLRSAKSLREPSDEIVCTTFHGDILALIKGEQE